MFYRMFDYNTAEKQLLDRIQGKLEARTPDELAADEIETRLSFQKFIGKHEKYVSSHRRIPNRKKYIDFLHTAEQMRRYTAIHEGIITIRAEEGGLGIIEMFFDAIFHMDSDASHSRMLLGLLFMKYKDISIYARQDGIVIQVFAELYDEEAIGSPNSDQLPS